ncbi:MAG TPA: non-homologous end-joining DNA ligase [Streptosporangiaceae bacterium]|nr:non-homologous end-joining DNA ligase [Streptosporangiaceae bacterium]
MAKQPAAHQEDLRGRARAANPTPAELRLGRLTVSLSNTDKILFPDDGISKGEVIGYYHDIAARMLPYLRGRPIAMARYPDGIDGERIFQKNVPSYFPGWVRTAEVQKQGGTVTHVVCDNAATLVYLANQGCVELHIFLSRADRIGRPDQLVFDLDPPQAAGFSVACRTALRLRELLADPLGLTAYVRTSGGKGLHVHVPLNRRAGFDDVRGFARAVAEVLIRRYPDQLTIEQRKEARSRRLFLDVMRNAYAQTIVAPYAVRARPGAPVATPLHWDELSDAALVPGRFTIRTISERLAGSPDPWDGFWSNRQDLRRAHKLLAEFSDR